MSLKINNDKFLIRKKKSVQKSIWKKNNSFTNKENKKFQNLNSLIRKNKIIFLKTFKKQKTSCKRCFKKNSQNFFLTKKINRKLKKDSLTNIYTRGSIFDNSPKIKHEEIIREKIIEMLIKKKKKKSILYKKRKAFKKRKSKKMSFINFLNKNVEFSEDQRKNHSLDLKKLNKNIILKNKNKIYFQKNKQNKFINSIYKKIEKNYIKIPQIKMKKTYFSQNSKKIIYQNFAFKHLDNYNIDDEKFSLPEIGRNLQSFN